MADAAELRLEAQRLFALAHKLNDTKINAAIQVLAWELERRARELDGGTTNG